MMYLEEQAQIANERDQSIEEPSIAIGEIKADGKFSIYFNAEMAGPVFLSELNKGLSAPGRVHNAKDTYRRLEDTEDEAFDLSKYLSFVVARGSDDSALPEELNFSVHSISVENELLYFKLEFENPLKVSTGSLHDTIQITVEDVSFFTVLDNGDNLGMTAQQGMMIAQQLPKMLPGEDYE